MKRTILAVIVAAVSFHAAAGDFGFSAQEAAKAGPRAINEQLAHTSRYNHAIQDRAPAMKTVTHTSETLSQDNAPMGVQVGPRGPVAKNISVHTSETLSQVDSPAAAQVGATAPQTTAVAHIDGSLTAAAPQAAAQVGMTAPQKTVEVHVTNTLTAAPAPAAIAQVKTQKVTNSVINVDKSQVPANTKVTVNGVETTAGALPEGTQIQVGYNSVFSAPAKKGGHDHGSSSHSEHGTGNGANNAANSNSAHGLGGGNHIGGGSAQSGSRNVGHW